MFGSNITAKNFKTTPCFNVDLLFLQLCSDRIKISFASWTSLRCARSRTFVASAHQRLSLYDSMKFWWSEQWAKGLMGRNSWSMKFVKNKSVLFIFTAKCAPITCISTLQKVFLAKANNKLNLLKIVSLIPNMKSIFRSEACLSIYYQHIPRKCLLTNYTLGSMKLQIKELQYSSEEWIDIQIKCNIREINKLRGYWYFALYILRVQFVNCILKNFRLIISNWTNRLNDDVNVKALIICAFSQISRW